MSRHEGEAHSWAMASRAPDSRLRSCVTDYVGYRESARDPMRRLQAPFAGIPMILTFGPEIDILNGDRPAARIFDVVRGCYTLTLTGNLGLTEKIRVEVNRPEKLFVSTLPLD